MTAQLMEWVLIVRYAPSAHRATYGRLPGTLYTKDYIQLSKKAKFVDDLKVVFPSLANGEPMIPITFKWPTGAASGKIIAHSADRPHLSWETKSGAPPPWRMSVSPSEWTEETIRGEPSLTSEDEADRQYDDLMSSKYGQPYLLAIKLVDELDTLHLRVLVDNPEIDFNWAALRNAPDEIQKLAAATSQRSALAWRLFAGQADSLSLHFDTAKKSNPWSFAGTSSGAASTSNDESSLSQGLAFREFEAAEDQQPETEFDPASQDDARRRIVAEIVRRQGQRKFRNEVMAAYGAKCPVTDCRVSWVLEAAHISPYRGTDTNKADNGFPLRGDIHTLFDLGLLSVNPETLEIRVAQTIQDPEYRALNGHTLQVGTVKPSKLALKEHWDRSTA